MSDTSSDPDPLLPLAEEFAERYRRGERPNLTEYTEKYPALAQRIRRLFPTLAVIEEFGSVDGEPTGPFGPAAGSAPRQLGEYRLLHEVGRGGMGVVYEAVQESLGRHVALKVLTVHGLLSPMQRQRFEREAKAAARLHHTNIVPVYGVGEAEGVNYYAMQFIPGRSVDGVLRELRRLRHGPDAGDLDEPTRPVTPPPGEEPEAVARNETPAAAPSGLSELSGRSDKEYFRSVARVGVQAAEALAHAHAQGVLHRDIKPANLLIDTQGNVWVTDFGLAKLEGSDDLTGEGEVPGTLRYMAPERFAGQADARSDIYSLGLTLYELLTLRPAFEAATRGEMIERILHADPPRPRTLEPHVPRDLEAVILKALAKEPAERYPTAQELADDLRRFLDDLPIRAKRPRLPQRMRKWARRHRPVVLTAAAGLFIVVAVLAIGTVWTLHQAASRWARTAHEVNHYLQEASLLRGQAQAAPVGDLTKWDAALGAANRAQAALNAGTADEETHQRVQALLAELEKEIAAARQQAEQMQRDQQFRNQLTEVRTLKEDEFDKQVDTDHAYRDAFAGWSLDVDAVATAEAARQLLSRPLEMRIELAAALDDWAWERRRRKRPASEWRHLVDLARAVDPDPWRDRLRSLDYLHIAQERDELLELARTARVSELPPASAELLGRVLRAAGEVGRAEDVLRQAQLLHPRDVWLNYELAETLKLQKPTPWGEVVRFYTAARSLRPEIGHALGHALEAHGRKDEAGAVFAELIRLRPANPRHHTCLGSALYAQGKLVEAEAEHHRALELAPNDAAARNNLGVVLQAKGRLDEAIQEFRAARDLYRDAESHSNLGGALVARGQLDEAITELQKALDIDPNYAPALNNFGAALLNQGRTDEAITKLNKAIYLAPKLATAHANLGRALADKHQLDDAIRELTVAIDLDPRLAQAHYVLGNALKDNHQLDDAIKEYRAAIDLDPKNAQAHSNLGVALKAKRQLDEAIKECQTAVDLAPKLAPVRYNLGVALYENGRLDEAITEYQEAVKLDPNHAKAHCNLGEALLEKRRLDEAITELKKARDLDPNDALTHGNLGLAYKAKGQLDEAITELKIAVKLNSKLDMAHGVLGEALLLQGRFAEARAATRRCLDLLPERHPARNFATRQLQQCERLIALDEKLPAILEGKEKPADAAERFALADLCLGYKRLPAAAARLCAEAFADPDLAENVKALHRYDAACAAALAGSGRGEDGARLADKERARWRQQAVDWLRAGLASWAKRLESGNPADRVAAVQQMQYWRKDADLAGIRDPAALARLPEAERETCRKLWVDVDALLSRGKPKGKEPPPEKP